MNEENFVKKDEEGKQYENIVKSAPPTPLIVGFRFQLRVKKGFESITFLHPFFLIKNSIIRKDIGLGIVQANDSRR